MTDRQTDDGQRIAALMMLAGGIKPRDAAKILKVRPEQIRAWMTLTGEPEPERGDTR